MLPAALLAKQRTLPDSFEVKLVPLLPPAQPKQPQGGTPSANPEKRKRATAEDGRVKQQKSKARTPGSKRKARQGESDQEESEQNDAEPDNDAGMTTMPASSLVTVSMALSLGKGGVKPRAMQAPLMLLCSQVLVQPKAHSSMGSWLT